MKHVPSRAFIFEIIQRTITFMRIISYFAGKGVISNTC